MKYLDIFNYLPFTLCLHYSIDKRKLQVIFTVNYFPLTVSITINKKISGRKCCVCSMITLISKAVLYITLIRGANGEAPRIDFIVILNVVIHLIPHIIYNTKDAA